jgi:hypothetical protein
MDDATVDAVRQALEVWKVLFFRRPETELRKTGTEGARRAERV